ncbi:MAG: class B sortase [Lachnospiraceae bacterium]|nr:class B sortase [Lachnospiraceae bacterium]
MKKLSRWLAGLVFIVSIVLLAISIYFLMGMFAEWKKADDLKQTLTAIYIGDDSDAGLDTEVVEDGEGGEVFVKAVKADETGVLVTPGLLALHEENSDCISWISIEGTAIDYPVMYHPEEENYYLKRDFYGNYSANGCIFLSELCDPETSDNLIVYGHHMKSGAMFAALEDYKDQDFYLEHSEIVFDTLHGMEIYEIIAVFLTPVYTGNDFAYYSFTGAETEDEFDEFIEEVMSRTLYDTGKSAAFGDKLLTLSTCEYSQANGRIVVIAKLSEQ